MIQPNHFTQREVYSLNPKCENLFFFPMFSSTGEVNSLQWYMSRGGIYYALRKRSVLEAEVLGAENCACVRI